MKKQIIILLLVLFNADLLWSQKFVKITTPCNDEFLRNVTGQWIHSGEGLNAKVSKQQQQEILDRLDKVHRFVFDICPSPLGIDAAWSRFTTDLSFAYQTRMIHLPDGRSTEDNVNGIPVVSYSYAAKFCQYSCGRESYEMMAGHPRENGAFVAVTVNSLNAFLPQGSQRGGPEELNIDGRTIQMMPVVTGKWKGYTLYQPEAGSGVSMFLIHREGMLPYTPVTRKQYLDRSISHFDKWFDKMLADLDQTDSMYAKLYTDMGKKPDWESRKEQKEKFKKEKKDVIKHYQDELVASTTAGLLDTTAIISSYIGDPTITHPIFTSESAGGRMLVTENPAYVRKDLPKYIPQFIVLRFEKYDWPFAPKVDPLKLEQENFPIEKLQAMIDK